MPAIRRRAPHPDRETRAGLEAYVDEVSAPGKFSIYFGCLRLRADAELKRWSGRDRPILSDLSGALWSDLGTLSMWRAARTVVQVGRCMPTSDQICRRVRRVHNRLDEHQVLVPRTQHVVEFFHGAHHEGFRGGIGSKHLGKFGVSPIRDVVVMRLLTQDGALDGVAGVVDQEDDRLEVMSQNGRQFLGGGVK